MLRPVSRRRFTSEGRTDSIDNEASLNESFDERQRKRAMSLRIFDGDIRLSCGSGTSSTFAEEREIDFDESTEGSKMLVDPNDNNPVDSISVSSEFDRELEGSDLSGDSISFASHEGVLGIEDELTLESEHEEMDGLADEKIAETASGAGTDIGALAVSDGLTGDEVVTGTDGIMKKEIVAEDSDLKRKQLGSEYRKAKIYDDIVVPMQDFQEEEKGEKEELSEKNGETVASRKEKEAEEKPAEIEGKEVSKTEDTNEIIHNNDSVSLSKSLDSVSSNLRTSKDEEEDLDKDAAIIFYEKELSRSREKLEGEPPSQNIIKCLVSLTTPRDLLSVGCCEQPAFVEFDMSQDGFGYLFVGNLTPFITQGILR